MSSLLKVIGFVLVGAICVVLAILGYKYRKLIASKSKEVASKVKYGVRARLNDGVVFDKEVVEDYAINNQKKIAFV